MARPLSTSLRMLSGAVTGRSMARGVDSERVNLRIRSRPSGSGSGSGSGMVRLVDGVLLQLLEGHGRGRRDREAERGGCAATGAAAPTAGTGCAGTSGFNRAKLACFGMGGLRARWIGVAVTATYASSGGSAGERIGSGVRGR